MWVEFLQSIHGIENIGLILLAMIFTTIGIFIRGMLTSHKDISVAKINANVSLGEQAMEVMVAAMETLKEENANLKENLRQIQSDMDRIIELLIRLIKAETQEEADEVVSKLQKYLAEIGRWPH